MTIYERLDDATRKALGANKPVVHRQSNKHKHEHLSEYDIRELMNANMPTYKRSKGRMKQK